MDEIAAQWAIDRTFKPGMPAGQRDKKISLNANFKGLPSNS
jgi:hypothetical protein